LFLWVILNPVYQGKADLGSVVGLTSDVKKCLFALTGWETKIDVT
jgi:hypothetical protein